MNSRGQPFCGFTSQHFASCICPIYLQIIFKTYNFKRNSIIGEVEKMQNVQNSLSLESLDNSIIISDKKYKILAGQTRRRNCTQNGELNRNPGVYIVPSILKAAPSPSWKQNNIIVFLCLPFPFFCALLFFVYLSSISLFYPPFLLFFSSFPSFSSLLTSPFEKLTKLTWNLCPPYFYFSSILYFSFFPPCHVWGGKEPWLDYIGGLSAVCPCFC